MLKAGNVYISMLTTITLCGFNAEAKTVRDGTVAVEVRLQGGQGVALTDDLAASVDARIVRHYEAASVARVPEARLKGLLASAAARGRTVIERRDWDRVHLPNASFDTRDPITPSGTDVTEYPNRQGLYVIQFDGPPTGEDEQRLRNFGVAYISYFPHNAALVVGSSDAIDRLAATEHVQWVTLYQPSFRAQPALLHQGGRAEYIVQLADVPNAQASALEITRLASDSSAYRGGRFLNIRGIFDIAAIQRFMRDPFVIGITRAAGAVFSGEREAIAVTSFSQSYFGETYQNGTRPFKTSYGDYRSWLSSRGVLDTSGYRIAFVDGGLDSPPGSFRGPHPDIWRSNLVAQSYVGGEDSSDGYGHGTLVVGMAVGDPTFTPPSNMTSQFDADGFLLGTGIAPKTGIYVQKVFSNFGFYTEVSPLTLANDAYYWGAAVQNHSYQQAGSDGLYSQQAQHFDIAVRDTYGDAPVTSMPMTVAAGNIAVDCTSGTCTQVTSPGTAKNVITVGGAESWRPNAFTACTGTAQRAAQDFLADSFSNVAWTSRRGTSDLRYKPEIIAPMTQISSTRTQRAIVNPNVPDGGGFCNHTGDHYYSFDTGTSFAAPQAAGACVLLDKKLNARLSPAMLKAALVGNATSVRYGTDRRTGGQVGARPNVAQGFGRLYLGDALSGQVTQTYLDESSWSAFTAPGQQRTRTFTVANTSRPTVIVLAWTDEPANFETVPTSSPKLVHDLDLAVHTDSCFAYTGNQMSNDVSFQNGACGSYNYDYRNNVEMIVLPAYSMSTFTVTISSSAWSVGGTQPFAVFTSNAF